MATKKFIIEVEEGNTECSECPFRQNDKMCEEFGWCSEKEFNCDKYNLATMKIKEMEEQQ